jgi:hypothetical protein
MKHFRDVQSWDQSSLHRPGPHLFLSLGLTYFLSDESYKSPGISCVPAFTVKLEFKYIDTFYSCIFYIWPGTNNTVSSCCSGHKKIPVCQCFLLPVKCVTCVNGAEGDAWGKGGAKSACGRGACRFTEWEWFEGKFTSLHKGLQGHFFPHMCCYIVVCMCCKYVLCYSYFSPKQVKINHMMEVQNMRLFLGP